MCSAHYAMELRPIVSTLNLFIISTLIWGTTWIAITFQIEGIAPEVSVSYRFALATILMLGLAWMKRRRVWLSFPEQRWMMLLGLLYAINYIFVYRAETQISSGLVAVAGSAILFFNIILSRFFFHHAITRELAIGALFGFSGIVVLFAPDIVAFSTQHIYGVCFSLISAFGASLANMVATRNSNVGISITTTNAWWMFWCAVFTAVAVPLTGNQFSFVSTPSYWLALFYLAIFGSVIAFSAYLTLLKRLGPGQAGYVAVLTPVVALIVSTLFEDLRWHWSMYLGVALIIAGQLLIIHHRSRLGHLNTSNEASTPNLPK